MSDQRIESPLAELERSPETGIEIEQAPFRGYLNVRGDPRDAAFLRGVETVAGVALPLAPNTVTHGYDQTALWLGPDEWLLVTPPDWQTDLARRLQHELEDAFAAVTDISSGQTAFALAGGGARTVIAKGCSLDLHPRAFAPGRCAQTVLAKTGVIVFRSEASTYELIVRRSFAEHLWLWLLDASRGMTRRLSPRGEALEHTPRLVSAVGAA